MDKKKILIVEDDSMLRESLQDFLSKEEFEVVAASDGEQGLEMTKTEVPDLILLDIILPKKNGYEVIKEIKADEAVKNIPIILLTNLGSLNDIEKALALGATTYLVKGDYKLEEIADKIRGVLG